MHIYLILINVLAFALYGIDKFKARRGVAALGGSIGAFLGMKLFHHKTLHPQFYIGIPVIFVLQVVLAVIFIWKFGV